MHRPRSVIYLTVVIVFSVVTGDGGGADETRHERCVALLKRREFSEARALLAEEIKSNPGDPSLHELLGIACGQIGDSDGAIRSLTEAIRIDPRRVTAYRNRGFAFVAKQDWDHAIADYTSAIRIEPGSAECFFDRASAFRSQCRYTEACADFERAYDLGLKDEAGFALATLLATCSDGAVRDGKRAVGFAKAACERRAFKDPVCMDLLASAYAEAGQWGEAIHREEEALKLYPSEASEGCRLRLEIFRRHVPYRAFSTSGSENGAPTSATDALLQGVAKGQACDFSGAARDLQVAVDLDPRLASAHFSLGASLSNLWDAPGAARHLGKCIELDPSNSHALACRAEAWLAMDKYREALADAEAALALSPEDFRARRAHTTASAGLGKLEDAIQLIQKMENEQPDKANISFIRGHCYLSHGCYEEAISQLDIVIRRCPIYAPAYADRAVAYSALNDEKRAKQDMDTCLRLAPVLKERTETRIISVRGKGMNSTNADK